MTSSQVIDAVMGRNEFELLDMRISYLSDAVDLFIVGESAFDFRGRPKPLHFHERKRQGKIPKHVIVFQIEIAPTILNTRDPRLIQDEARKVFLAEVTQNYPSDLIFFSDIDEIQSQSQVAEATCLPAGDVLASVPMRMFYRRINWELAREKKWWVAPKLIRGRAPEGNIRSLSVAPLGGEPGCHFSYLGLSSSGLESKLSNLAATEFNIQALSNSKYLEFCDFFGLDHLARSNSRGFGLLRYQSPDGFGDVQRFAASFSPLHLGRNFRPNLLLRLLAAQLALSIRVNSLSVSDVESPAGGFRYTSLYWFGLNPLLLTAVKLGWLALQKKSKRTARKGLRVARLAKNLFAKQLAG